MIMRLFYRIQNIPKEIKWLFQKLYRGYTDYNIWGLDTYICKQMYKPLKHFVRIEKHGIPNAVFSEFDLGESDKEFKLAEKKWQQILNDILFAVEYHLYDQYDQNLLNKYQMKLFEKKYGNIHEEKEEYLTSLNCDIDWLNKPYYYNIDLDNQFRTRAQRGFELLGKYLQNLWD